jgi:hypothetical protein
VEESIEEAFSSNPTISFRQQCRASSFRPGTRARNRCCSVRRCRCNQRNLSNLHEMCQLYPYMDLAIMLTEPPRTSRGCGDQNIWKSCFGSGSEANHTREFLVIGHGTVKGLSVIREQGTSHVRWMHVLVGVARNLDFIVDRNDCWFVRKTREPPRNCGRVPGSVCTHGVRHRCDIRSIREQSIPSVGVVCIKLGLVCVNTL